MSSKIKGLILGMLCGALLMVALFFSGHAEWGGAVLGLCILIGILIGSFIKNKLN